MSPDQVQSLTGTLGGISAIPEQNNALEKQMEMAKLLREGPTQPQGTHIAPGSVYVGPNALQSAAAGLNQYNSMMMDKKAIDKMTSNAGQLQKARTDYMDLMSRVLGGQPSAGQGDPQGGGP